MIADQNTPRQWPPVEPVLPKELETPPTGLPRPTGLSVSEPESRSFWVILAVILFFVLAAGGGYYWFTRPGPAPMSAQTVRPVPSSNTAPVQVRSDAPPVERTPQFATGLRPLNVQRAEQSASTPEAPQPPPAEPDQQEPQLAVGLRSRTEQQPNPTPPPPAEVAPPAEPPSAAIPHAKPPRKAAQRGSPSSAPQQSSSSPVRF